MQGQALVVTSTIHSAWLSEVLPAPKRGHSGFVLSKYCTASSPAQPGCKSAFTPRLSIRTHSLPCSYRIINSLIDTPP